MLFFSRISGEEKLHFWFQVFFFPGPTHLNALTCCWIFSIFEFSSFRAFFCIFWIFRIFEFSSFRAFFALNFSIFWIFEFSCVFWHFLNFSNFRVFVRFLLWIFRIFEFSSFRAFFWIFRIFEFSRETLPYSRNNHVTKKKCHSIHIWFNQAPFKSSKFYWTVRRPTAKCCICGLLYDITYVYICNCFNKKIMCLNFLVI